jgi:hypothetical protein
LLAEIGGGFEMRLIARWRYPLSLVVLFVAAFVFGMASPALGNHGSEPCGDTYKQQSAASESVNLSVMGRAAVKSDARVIAPQPLEDEIVRSFYLFKTEDDFVEFGYHHVSGSFALVFSVKEYNGSYSFSYDGYPGNPNPGAGPLTEGTDHTFQIWRNPNGNDANHIEMHRDGLYFGFYFHDRVAGAAVIAGTEGFSKCDDMFTHAWTMKKKDTPSSSWTNWSAVRVVNGEDIGTKWWYNEKTQSPPAWWLKHCSSANCADV